MSYSLDIERAKKEAVEIEKSKELEEKAKVISRTRGTINAKVPPCHRETPYRGLFFNKTNSKWHIIVKKPHFEKSYKHFIDAVTDWERTEDDSRK